MDGNTGPQQQAPPAVFNTEMPAPQAKDASVGYPVAPAAPASPPATPSKLRDPKTWLYVTAIALAFACMVCQGVFLGTKWTKYTYTRQGYFVSSGGGGGGGGGGGYYYGSGGSGYSGGGGSGYSGYSGGSSGYSSSGLGSNEFIKNIGTSVKAASEPSVRKLLQQGKGSAPAPMKYSDAVPNRRLQQYGYGPTVKFNKGQTGMVMAAAVIALVAAVALLALHFVPREWARQWGVRGAAVAVPIVLALWIVSMACSAKVAAQHKTLAGWYGASRIPKGWVASNAIALTCAILSMFVWGALLVLVATPLVKQLLAKKSEAAAVSKAAAVPAAHPAAASYGGAPAAVVHVAPQQGAVPAGQHASVPAAVAPAPPAAGPVAHNPAYAAAPPAAYAPAGHPAGSVPTSAPPAVMPAAAAMQ